MQPAGSHIRVSSKSTKMFSSAFSSTELFIRATQWLVLPWRQTGSLCASACHWMNFEKTFCSDQERWWVCPMDSEVLLESLFLLWRSFIFKTSLLSAHITISLSSGFASYIISKTKMATNTEKAVLFNPSLNHFCFALLSFILIGGSSWEPKHLCRTDKQVKYHKYGKFDFHSLANIP